MYRIRLQDFEGPLDLLLFFIQRDELDIYDIPIAQIADEFLAYVRLLEEVDLDGVADFIYMAAVLIDIKVRMVLPRPELDESGEPIDPRRELVERLLEYMRYKEAAQHLEVIYDRRSELFTRGAASSQKKLYLEEGPEELVETTLFDLVSVLRRILTESAEEVRHAVESFSYSVEQQMVYIEERLQSEGKCTFLQLARHSHKGFIIATFLAILEMARQQRVLLSMTRAADDFYVVLQEPVASHPATNGSVTPQA